MYVWWVVCVYTCVFVCMWVVCVMLNSNPAITCSVNDDGIMPVDLAVMLGHTEIVKLLQSKGAKDSPKCKSSYHIWLVYIIIPYMANVHHHTIHGQAAMDVTLLHRSHPQHLLTISCSVSVCRDPFVRFSHITSQLMEYERRVESAKMDMLTHSSGSLKDLHQKLKWCEAKASLFARMKAHYEQAGQ